MRAAGELQCPSIQRNARLLPLFHSVNYLITLRTNMQVHVGLAKKLEQQTSSSIPPQGLILFPLFRYNEIAQAVRPPINHLTCAVSTSK